jgi:hypothetical protein
VNLSARAAIYDPLQGGGSMPELTPGARAGLEPATLVVNAGSGCSAAMKPREAVIVELVTCWYPRGIEWCEAHAVRSPPPAESFGRPSDGK